MTSPAPPDRRKRIHQTRGKPRLWLFYHGCRKKERGFFLCTPLSNTTAKFCNCLFFKLFRFPRKELLQHIQEREYGEIVQVKSFIRVCIKKQYTAVCLVVRYSIRTAGESKNQHVITEKEMVFKVQAEKKELIALVRPYLSRLYESNKKEAADLIRSYFEEYVNPTSLSSIAGRITRDQEKRATAMLAAYFGF